MESTQNGDVQSAETVDVGEYWRIFRRRAGSIALTVLVATLVTGAYAWLSTPIYRAEALLLPAEAQEGGGALAGIASQYGGLAALAGVNVDARDGREESLAILKSREFIGRFVNEQKISALLLEDAAPPPYMFWKRRRTDQLSAVDHFRNRVLRVSAAKNSGLVTLAIEWKDREMAAKWANSLVKALNDHMKERAVDESNKSLRFLADEIAKTSKIELQAAASYLVQSQMQQSMLANVRDEYAFRAIDPAVVPAEDEYVKPKRWLIMVLGALVGLLLGSTFALVANATSQTKK